jgi:hypothetical protein
MTKQQKSRFEIAVTQADIDRAIQSNSAKCVVAQAIARTLPDAMRIDVDTQTIRFTMNGERYAYLTPYSVTGYVIAFDAGDEITPFRFRLYDDQKIEVRVRRRTPAGQAQYGAAKKAKRTKQQAVEAQQQLEGVLRKVDGALTDPTLPPPTPSEIAEIRTKAAAAKAAAKNADEQAASVKAAFADAQKVETSSAGRSVKRVFKTNTRHYGHRALRINQANS